MDYSTIKISIIVPIYNAEDSVLKCINSIKAQTHRNLQILLIDDGSTDRSLEICKSSVEDDIRMGVYHKKNEGSVAARKYGLDLADGDYIGFVDADDYVDPQMFSELLQVLYESDADFVHSGYIEEKCGKQREECNFVQQIVDIKDSQSKAEFLIQNILKGSEKNRISCSLWSKLFKAQLIRKCFGALDDGQQYGEDFICLFRCILESQRIMLYRKAMYHYFVKENSLSHLKPDDYIVKEIGMWHFTLKVLEEYQYLEIVKDEICHFLKRKMMQIVFCNNQTDMIISRYFFKEMDRIIGKKIILFGAGDVGKDYYTQISKYKKCTIVAWSDSNWVKYHFKYIHVTSLKDALALPFDLIVIAVRDENTAEEIRSMLVEARVPESKILWDKPGEFF